MAKKEDAVELDIKITDPEVYQPRERPMLVTPGEGKSWKNKEQEAFAKFVNDFAYEYPDKFAREKDVLAKNLADIGNDPQEYYRLAGLSDPSAASVTATKQSV